MSTPWAAAALAALLLSATCSAGAPAATEPPPIGPSGAASSPAAGGTVRHFELTAAPMTLQLGPGATAQAWAYNGQVPGPELRVRVGDQVVVTLHNRLSVGTSLHWHGLTVPNGEDGVAGVTQDAVPAGATAIYSFVAGVAGTYWYHSHQDSASQVGRGLYGALVVDPATGPPPDVVDQTLIYDDWPLGLLGPKVARAGDPLLITYTTYSVNGRTGSAIRPVSWRPGQLVRLRLVAAGNLVHFLHPDGIAYRVVAFDGHQVAGGPLTTDVLPLGPGERVDIEFEGPATSTWLRVVDSMPPAAAVSVPLLARGAPAPDPGAAPPVRERVLDPFTYPARADAAETVPPDTAADRGYTITLTSTAMPSMPGMTSPDGMAYEMNGAVFPQTGTLDVSTGDIVRLTFSNRTRVDHPIHLHGHAFTLVSENGATAVGAVVKDTVVVHPGAQVTVAFRAHNPGWWMLHCHQLYHAAGGMMMLLRYTGAPRLAELGGRYHSQPD